MRLSNIQERGRKTKMAPATRVSSSPFFIRFLSIPPPLKLKAIMFITFVCCLWSGAGLGLFMATPTTAGPFMSKPLCLHSCNYYLTLAALPAGYHFNPSRAHPGTGHSKFPRERGFFLLPSSNRAATLLICCDPLRKRCFSRERDNRCRHRER